MRAPLWLDKQVRTRYSGGVGVEGEVVGSDVFIDDVGVAEEVVAVDDVG
jgi:hypothetical protein